MPDFPVVLGDSQGGRRPALTAAPGQSSHSWPCLTLTPAMLGEVLVLLEQQRGFRVSVWLIEPLLAKTWGRSVCPPV